ncbi:MAG: sugar ABC transporter ATP-binding protein [Oscillospiraceae bacterium]|nr:sugar ABC transporter ATP-binding protein [Oscillospiraceae bacterium]MCL2277812.1 sugar ABC transporter ATP-binding protein [Oscillospiraceae bacterium]
MPDDVVMTIRGVNKSFAGVQVLFDADMDIKRGEVHVLVGENGAGKSTLMKIISGVFEKDSGEITLDGKVINPCKIDPRKLGVSIIHQEFNLLNYRTVGQNIFLGREPLKNKILGIVDEAEVNRKSKEILDFLGMDVDVDEKVGTLGVAQQQMVEVAKALSYENTKVLIMDEPTAALTNREITRLFEMIFKLRDEGVSVIYISHRLEEIRQIADRITVLRDGIMVKTLKADETDIDEIIKLMVGREIKDQYNRDFNEPGEELISTENIASYRFKDININLKQGEIVGISGLVGAGRTELVKSIFGGEKVESGKVKIFGKEYKKTSAVASTRLKLGFIPEDRKVEGAAIDRPLRQNVIQASLRRLFPAGILSSRVEKKYSEKYVQELNIRTTSINKPVYLLSGGNQQKVIVAKWLCAECNVIIFDEPTRGIDVGAKAEIYSIMNDFVKQPNKGILMVSSDLPELLGVCDRIYVMKDGKITAEFTREEATQEKILAVSV